MHSPGHSQQPQFIDKVTYFETLTRRVSQLKTGDRVAIMTMSFDTEQPEVMALVAALTSAAKKGATVLLSVDAYSFMVRDYERPNGIARVKQPSVMHGIFAQRYAMLQELEKHGGRYVVTNQEGRTFAMPATGRSHIKFGVINDDVWIGGCNLNDAAHTDLMAGWHDPKLADWLVALPGRAEQAGSVRAALGRKDIILPTACGAELLIDAGVRRQSHIMEQALRLIDEAEQRIVLTCQYFPNSKTVRHLSAAVRRGVAIELIYNHPSKHLLPGSLLHHGVHTTERLVQPQELFTHQLPKSHPFIHAKLLITEKAAMLGSHNYVQAGVDFGTAEFALLSQDHAFAANAEVALRAQLK